MATVFFSDVHIGDSESKHAALLEYLRSEQKNIDKIVIVGDFLDFWASSVGEVLSIAGPFVDFLATNYKNRLHYIIGNHDTDLVALKGAIPFVHTSLRFPIGKKMGIALHGDLIDPNKLTRSRVAQIATWFVNKFDRWAHVDSRKSIISLSGLIKEDPNGKLIREYEQRIVDIFASKYDYVLTGHTHIPCIKKFNNLVYINVGDQMEHNTVVIGKSDGFYLYDYIDRKILDSCQCND